VFLPDKKLLRKTGDVDYYNWNYSFPINIIQKYRFNKILQLLGNAKYSRLLEIGTGSGIFLPELSKHCSNLYACDIHDNYGHIAELLRHYKIKNCEAGRQNIEATDYPDNSFDAIVAVSVLEFVADIKKALREINRILKPDGIFITICPMESKLLDAVLSLYAKKNPDEDFGDARKFTSKLLEENFKVLSKGYMLPLIGKWFPVYTHYKLGKNSASELKL
jgi:ubiquinone/menaquinone biosynthesis C-methylase UbiE